MAVAIGSKVRPEFTSDYGRVACFARRGAQLFFVTCDHVVKAYSGHPDQGPIPMHAPDESGEPTCGVYGGDSLIEPPDRFEGDLAMVRIRDTPGDPGVLPPGGPASQVARIALPVPGESVLVWSGRWGSFLPARVVAVPSSQSLPHPRYGPMPFPLQFSAELADPSRLPQHGDSGGPMLRPDGALVGVFQVGFDAPPTGPCLVYGVPLSLAFADLGVVLLA